MPDSEMYDVLLEIKKTTDDLSSRIKNIEKSIDRIHLYFYCDSEESEEESEESEEESEESEEEPEESEESEESEEESEESEESEEEPEEYEEESEDNKSDVTLYFYKTETIEFYQIL